MRCLALEVMVSTSLRLMKKVLHQLESGEEEEEVNKEEILYRQNVCAEQSVFALK